jgi:HD-like signal output (HDOD) protein
MNRPDPRAKKMDHYRLIQTLQNMESIGALPSISIRIFRKLNDNDFEIDDITRLILQDPAICAQILKVANSAYYSRGTQIPTISQAVTHLGTNIIKRILFAIEMIGLYPGTLAIEEFNESEFWRHTLAGALLTQEIARRNNLADHESLYLAALLNNLGILVVRQYFPDKFRDICQFAQKRKVSFAEAEDFLMGLDHHDIAYLVAVRWGLPTKLLYAFKSDLNQVGDMKTVTEIIQISQAILSTQKYGQWDAYDTLSVPEELLERYQLGAELITHLCDTIFTEVNELSIAIRPQQAAKRAPMVERL